MNPNDENCGNCHFWRQRPLGSGYHQSFSPHSFCMRFPPSIPPRGDVAEYPRTERGDWCGEHAEKV